MSDQNKKGGEQVAKRNPEEDVTWLFLEASLNMGVAHLKLHEMQSGKNKVLDGARNKVFLMHSNQQYKYYLGHFGIDKLEKEKIANNDNLPSGGQDIKGLELKKNINKDKISYKIYIGYVNWKNTWDISDIKDVITSFSPEINPIKNKSKAFRYLINANDSTNKIGSLKLHILAASKDN